jgi:hypothetical protein
MVDDGLSLGTDVEVVVASALTCMERANGNDTPRPVNCPRLVMDLVPSWCERAVNLFQ